jgi:iron complex outermembrane receptor protein
MLFQPIQTKTRLRAWLAAAFVGLTLGRSFAANTNAPAPGKSDLCEMNLEELVHIKVTSVTKTPEDRFGAAAAVFVIDQDELRRSGVTSIPDALRTVPGLDVGQIDSHRWAVSARGFNGELASKLLVLVDGRSVYSPINSGVYWDAQNMVLEDVDRIEVVRGPGGTLWGANAVNGVINIISKRAQETQGLLISGGGGTEERGFGTIRYGGKLGDGVYYRAYTKYFNHDDSALPGGAAAGDVWEMAQSGFRLDWDASTADRLTLQGDTYRGREKQTQTLIVPVPLDAAVTANATDRVAGGNILGRWAHVFSDDADFQAQLYYDRTERENALPSEDRDTFDFDFQNRFPLCARQSVLWGAGYRLTSDQIKDGYSLMFAPDHRTDQVFNTFVQDEITLVSERLRLTLGSKFECNDYTGFEVQPNVRLAWTPTVRQTFWGAISRAVRTPSRAEDDVRITIPAPGLPVNASILGNESGLAEELMAYELGYRVVPHERVTLDIAAFYNVYDRLRSLSPTTPPATPPASAFAFASANDLKGESYGAEIAAQWQATANWRLQAAYTYFHLDLRGPDANTLDFLEGDSPRHQFSLRSSVDLTRTVQFDSTLRYVDALSAFSIGGYVTLDLRLAWQATRNLEFAVVGQNLLDGRHAEFGSSIISTPQAEVERSIYAKVTWRF